MKVYILKASYCGGCPYIMGVYRQEFDAKKQRDQYRIEKSWTDDHYYYDYYVEEHKLI